MNKAELIVKTLKSYVVTKNPHRYPAPKAIHDHIYIKPKMRKLEQ